jgi:hypothetical protein
MWFALFCYISSYHWLILIDDCRQPTAVSPEERMQTSRGEPYWRQTLSLRSLWADLRSSRFAEETRQADPWLREGGLGCRLAP